jgi:hypothetical protein
MSSASGICPCDRFVHPRVISNPAGRNSIVYRVGDYVSFREALLRSRDGEIELANWRPGAQGDLAVQMVEWWAYLADILTFYNERIANEDYLRTALLPESVQRLIRILGYRPRPGIGATGTLAALMTGNKSLTLPSGFQVQSKPGPGKQPQTFELGAKTLVESPDVISADPVPSPLLLGNEGTSVLLRGVITSIKPGDNLLLLEKGWSGTDKNYAVLTVASTAPEKDPRGNVNTRVTFAEAATQLLTANASDYRLLKSSQSAHVWQYPAQTVIASNQVDLDRISRAIKVGDPVLFDVGSITAARGIYFSPDGKNLGGGGNTVSLGVLDRTIVQMISYQSGVITAYDDGSIYYSRDGQNLGGGGNTVQVYSGNMIVQQMIPYGSTGVITAFFQGPVFYSPDGNNLGGGGSTTEVDNGVIGFVYLQFLVPFQGGVLAGWDDGSIYFSSDGTNLYDGTSQQRGSPFAGLAPIFMIPYASGLITAISQAAGYAIYYSTDGQNPVGGANATQVYSGSLSIQAIVNSQSGVVTAFSDGTVYLSKDGNNLGAGQGQTTQSYGGPNLVVNMIAFQTGVLVAFDDGSVYYSPDGTHLKGGGSTNQVYGSTPGPVFLLAYNSGVLAAFPAPQLALVSVTSYQEVLWYANPKGSDPTQPPTGSPPPIAIVIPHTRIVFQPAVSSFLDYERSIISVLFSWRDVGTPIPTPSTILSGTTLALRTPVPSALLPMTAQDILLSDKNGNGVEAAATVGTSDPSALGLSNANGPTDATWASMLASLDLAAPLSVLFDLLPVSRGKTVSNEILGSGDATITTGQEFVLQKSPLTYLQSADSASGSGYNSTLQVWVDGAKWYEVPSFYGQPASAHIFVTREDEQNMTHVQFGDGVNGARIPTGLNNVVATYRYGSGAESPDPGSLSVILKPWPGLKAIVNPVAAGGGADPDPPRQIKKYAPQSVLTFGRAISADDYEVIAAQAPGVARARSYWSWDTGQQRMLVKVYVGDDASALSNAQVALAGASDPNRPLNVIQATPMDITLSLTLVIDPSYAPADVVSAATAALVDPDNGILGTNVVQIGQSIFQSQIYQACLNVPGVTAVHSLQLSGANAQTCADCPDCDYRYDPGEGGFFVVTTPANQIISPEVAGNGG